MFRKQCKISLFGAGRWRERLKYFRNVFYKKCKFKEPKITILFIYLIIKMLLKANEEF